MTPQAFAKVHHTVLKYGSRQPRNPRAVQQYTFKHTYNEDLAHDGNGAVAAVPGRKVRNFLWYGLGRAQVNRTSAQ